MSNRIFHIKCGTPPKGCTLEEWRAWRAAEDIRMMAEVFKQTLLHAELRQVEPEEGALPN